MFPVIDQTVQYRGPAADFASLTGSPFWGFGVDEVIRRFGAAGAAQSRQR